MADPEEPEKFVVVPPAKGTFRIAYDVMVRHTGDEWIAIGPEPAVEGEIAQLGFGGTESLVSFDVTVLESRPTIVQNIVRHRLRLGMPGLAATEMRGKSAAETLLEAGWATAVLTREHEVRLLAFSMLGCALESDWRIRSRTRGHLRVSLGGIDLAENVEIVVCLPCGEGPAYELGVRFGESESAPDLSHPDHHAEGLKAFVRGLMMGNIN